MSDVVRRSGTVLAVVTIAFLATTSHAAAQKKYDTGASDVEIRIGNIVPYSGPASAYGTIGKTEQAYFEKVNAEGGINGRKIKFTSYDDGYSPPKTVEQARRLVESDEVLLIFGVLGTPPNSAIQRYLNAKKVPQLFIATGATKWGNPTDFPWTMGWQPNYQSECRVYAKHILATKPDGKIAVLYQNDDFGKDLLRGLKDGLGAQASMIVAEDGYEVSEPTIDTHIVKLKASGADIFVNFSSPKFAAQAIKKIPEVNWKPMQFIAASSASVGGVMKPAGFENSQNIITAGFAKDPSDARWRDDVEMKRFNEFLDKYRPDVDRNDAFVVYAYNSAQTLEVVLRRCGDDLTRENIMRQAGSLKELELGLLLPGIKINTSSTDFFPIEQMQLMRFSGSSFEIFGDVISGNIGG